MNLLFIRTNMAFLLSLVICFSLGACQSVLLSKKNVADLNLSYSKRTFRVRKDLFATFSDPDSSSRKILFRRGQKLRIWVESKDDWIKVRAVLDRDRIENNPGKTILYILREIMENQKVDEAIIESYPKARLEKQIAGLLE